MIRFFNNLRRAMLIGVVLIVGLLIAFGIYGNQTDPNRQIWQFNHLHYDVTLQDDGSAAVRELRTFNFERGRYTFGEFNLAVEAEDILVLENGMPYTQLDGPLSSRPERHFALTLAEGGRSYRVAWYYRVEEPQERTFEIRYVIPDAAFSYDDSTVYFQKYLSESNETKIEKITVSVHLPAGITPENTKIFGHGPAYGSIEFADDDPSRVDLLVEKIEPGRYVEARFLMPAGILPDASSRPGAVYDEILAEELEAAAQADRERLISQVSLGLALALLLLILLATVFLRIKHRENFQRFKPLASPPYLRDAPSPLPPAIVSRLDAFYRRQPTSADLISLCLLDLISRRVIGAEARIEGKSEETYLSRLPGDHAVLDIEKPILEFLFVDAAAGKDFLSLKELKRYCRSQRNLREIKHLLTSFDSNFKSLWQKYGFEEKVRNIVPGKLIFLRIASLALAIGGLANLLYFQYGPLFAASWVLLIGGGFVSLFNLIFCHKKRMLSQNGENELALWQSLGRFFADLTAFDEKELPEIDLWEKLLVYAAALGVADKVIRQLQMRYPQLDDPYYMRQHLYVYSGLRLASGGSNSFSGLQTSLSSSFRSAQSVVTSQSSSSGGGGGFSSGGSSGGGGAGGSSGGGVG